MMTRVTKVLVGKDITRTASIVDIYSASPQPASGEILVLDKYKKPLSAGSTILDSDVIYICQGTGDTYNYTNDAGTTVTAARVLKFSDPIEGKLVKNYFGRAYSAKAQRVITFAAITAPATAGTEFVLRIVYKDVNAKRGQFSKTYRFIAADTTPEHYFDGLRAAITADKGARIVGSGSTTLILTGKEIPEGTTALTDIDKYQMVDFDAFLTYVNSSTVQTAITTGGTKTSTTSVEYGQGEWEQIRDLEKDQLGYEGILDQISFPLETHSLSTVVDETYDQVIIEHDRSYLSPDNQYVKAQPMTTIIAIPYTATTNQMDSVLAVLNPWMASCPGAFTNISF
jgi:hypothetical protein